MTRHIEIHAGPMWAYIGCSNGSTGHRVEVCGTFVSEEAARSWRWHLQKYDGNLVKSPPARLYDIQEVVRIKIEGRSFSAIGFWDRTVDTRPGSHVTVLAVDPRGVLSAQDLFQGFKDRWPVYAGRFNGMDISFPRGEYASR